jgi:hypothetical protein
MNVFYLTGTAIMLTVVAGCGGEAAMKKSGSAEIEISKSQLLQGDQLKYITNNS